MPLLTTGSLARILGVSEKAVRLWTDRGLLAATRDGDGPRSYDVDQVVRGRTVVLLRALDVALSDVAAVLDATDPVAEFDELWDAARATLEGRLAAATYVRSVLAGRPALDLEHEVREVPARLLLTIGSTATLGELAGCIPALTERLFTALEEAGAALAGAPAVVYHERATEHSAARITVQAPVGEPLAPPPGMALIADEPGRELVVGLNQEQAADQSFVVAVHDHVALGAGDGTLAVVGDNRETYLPSWGRGLGGPVMEVSAPVTPR
ncbi:MerR family transcriptional regulator [Sanguibacter sp. A247]|uniref:MerR family transcriptional regulator n=1 Tax=unclassified Sanguibacter TaxID=2645534 RepID=UPI003FD838B2